MCDSSRARALIRGHRGKSELMRPGWRGDETPFRVSGALCYCICAGKYRMSDSRLRECCISAPENQLSYCKLQCGKDSSPASLFLEPSEVHCTPYRIQYCITVVDFQLRVDTPTFSSIACGKVTVLWSESAPHYCRLITAVSASYPCLIVNTIFGSRPLGFWGLEGRGAFC
jgi:hypothetical protein